MALVQIIEGRDAGKRFPLSKDIVSFGREDTCTYQILDDTVSRTHLQILLKDGRHHAGDYRSSNGVFVNDKQILQHTPLKDGDRVRIGQTTLVYVTDEASSVESVAQRKQKGQWEVETLVRKH